MIGHTINQHNPLFYNKRTACTALVAIYIKSYWPMILLLLFYQFYCISPLEKIIVADLDFLMIYVHSRDSYSSLLSYRRSPNVVAAATRSFT